MIKSEVEVNGGQEVVIKVILRIAAAPDRVLFGSEDEGVSEMPPRIGDDFVLAESLIDVFQIGGKFITSGQTLQIKGSLADAQNGPLHSITSKADPIANTDQKDRGDQEPREFLMGYEPNEFIRWGPMGRCRVLSEQGKKQTLDYHVLWHRDLLTTEQ